MRRASRGLLGAPRDALCDIEGFVAATAADARPLGEAVDLTGLRPRK